MIELHIEQGPILENEGVTIGVVTGVQGMRWYEVTVWGEDAHTGASPMHLRKNALLGAARVINAVDAIGREFAPLAVATVGLIENRPNSRNVVPGEVFFTVDMRHPQDDVLEQMEQRLRLALAAILGPLGLTYEEKQIWMSPAVGLPLAGDGVVALLTSNSFPADCAVTRRGELRSNAIRSRAAATTLTSPARLFCT